MHCDVQDAMYVSETQRMQRGVHYMQNAPQKVQNCLQNRRKLSLHEALMRSVLRRVRIERLGAVFAVNKRFPKQRRAASQCQCGLRSDSVRSSESHEAYTHESTIHCYKR